MKRNAFLIAAITLALFSCEREVIPQNYNYNNPDSVHFFVPYDTTFAVVRYHYYVTMKHDTIHEWQDTITRSCGSFGGGSCPSNYQGIQVIHYNIWQAPDCPKYCLAHDTIH